MFQNYTANVVKTPDILSVAVDLKTTTSQATSVNKAQRYVTGGVNGVSRQIQLDTSNDNVMMSFDGSVVATEGNDFVAFVYTYAATAPIEGDFILPQTRVSLVPFFNIQGCGYFQGNVVVPRLQLETGEQQYVMVGVASVVAKASSVSMYLDMKMHLSDQQVFQPSK